MKTCARILLVEDDADSAEALCLLLQAHGFEVEWAASADEAIVRFDAPEPRHVDAIILDLTLPDMDGVALVSRLARFRPLPPVVIHSAASKQVTEEAGKRLGAAAVLRKPVTWERMREALDRCGAFAHIHAN